MEKKIYPVSLYKHSDITEQILAALYAVYFATPYEVGLLLNFGPKPEQKRRSFDNNRKEWWLAQNRS